MRYLIFCYSVCVESPYHIIHMARATWLRLFRTERAKAFSNRFIKVNGFTYAAICRLHIAPHTLYTQVMHASHELCENATQVLEKYRNRWNFTSRINHHIALYYSREVHRIFGLNFSIFFILQFFV